jgi:hypothetical protein
MGILQRILGAGKALLKNPPRSRSAAAKTIGKAIAQAEHNKPLKEAKVEGTFPGKAPPKKGGWLSRWLTKGLERLHGKSGKRGEGVPAEGPFTPWEEGTKLPPEKVKEIPQDEMTDFLENNGLLIVQSSNVQDLQYFPDENMLVVSYRNGRAYIVRNISPEEARAFATATSKGSHVWSAYRGEDAKKMPSTPGRGGKPPGPAPHIKDYERIR